MARENQGLQIALIVFVMLTILLGVTTFIFFRQYEEATQAATTAQQQATERTQQATKIQDDYNELKRLAGFAPTDERAAIEELHRQDMLAYAGNFPEENRFYRPVLQYLNTVVKDKNVELASAKDEIETLKKQYMAREGQMKPQIDSAVTRADTAEKDKQGLASTYADERKRITGEQQQLSAQLASVRKTGEDTATKLSAEIEGTKKQLAEAVTGFQNVKTKLDEATSDKITHTDGAIVWVNQRAGTVWINLGRADGLNRQATFSVFPPNVNDLSSSGKKASIEVTQILGDHQAEARIVDDNISDPIMPGDRVHTPIWNPGDQKHFALAGFIDINGDGAQDLETIKNIIAINGGVLDAEQDVRRKTRRGLPTANTDFLVVGEPPTEKSDPKVLEEYQMIVDAAKKNLVPRISVEDLLQQMGWKKNEVVAFGEGADPADFAPKADPTVPTRSSDSGVSPLFRSRKPPRSGTAY